MKIVENTSHRLVLKNRSGWIGGFLVVFCGAFVIGGAVATYYGQVVMGVAWILAGLLVAVLGVTVVYRRVTVAFDRTLGRITYAARGLFGGPEKRYRLDDFQGAVTQTRSGGDDGRSHRCVLMFAKPDTVAQLPLTAYFTSGSGAARTAATINAWHTGRAPAAIGMDAFEV